MGQYDEIRAKIDSTRNQRLVNFDTGFWTESAEYIKRNQGSPDVENNKINFPTKSLPSKEIMWNKYLELSRKKGIKANYQSFNQNYGAIKNAEDAQLIKLIDDSKLLGVKNSGIRQQFKDNPELKAKLMKLVQSGAVEDIEGLLPLFKKEQTFGSYYKDLGDYEGESLLGYGKKILDKNPVLAPVATAGAAYAGYQASKFGVQKAKDMLKGKKTTGTVKNPIKANFDKDIYKNTVKIKGTRVDKDALKSVYKKSYAKYVAGMEKSGNKDKALKFTEYVEKNKKKIHSRMSADEIKKLAKKKFNTKSTSKTKSTPKTTVKKGWNIKGKIKGGIKPTAMLLAIQKAMELLHNNSEE